VIILSNNMDTYNNVSLKHSSCIDHVFVDSVLRSAIESLTVIDTMLLTAVTIELLCVRSNYKQVTLLQAVCLVHPLGGIGHAMLLYI